MPVTGLGLLVLLSLPWSYKQTVSVKNRRLCQASDVCSRSFRFGYFLFLWGKASNYLSMSWKQGSEAQLLVNVCSLDTHTFIFVQSICCLPPGLPSHSSSSNYSSSLSPRECPLPTRVSHSLGPQVSRWLGHLLSLRPDQAVLCCICVRGHWPASVCCMIAGSVWEILGWTVCWDCWSSHGVTLLLNFSQLF